VIGSVVYAANISFSVSKNDASYNDSSYGDVSKLQYQGTNNGTSSGNYCYTMIHNTLPSSSQTTLRVNVRTESYNEYAHTVSSYKTNSNNSLAPGAAIGTLGVTRMMGTSVYSEYHKGDATANNAAGTQDSYCIHIF
jgi:hypothetical protein